jgi:hypothetical protein
LDVGSEAEDAEPVGAQAEYDEALARRFADAFSRDDVDAVVALLADDAWLAMPPATQEYRGRAAVAMVLRASAQWRGDRRLQLVPTRANGQPAFGCYLPTQDHAEVTGVLVLTTAAGHITGITRFLVPHLHAYFALPGRLSPQRPATSS